MIPEIRLEVETLLSNFRIDEGELRRLLRDPINRDLARRAVRVESAAKRNATGRPGPNVVTGRLRGSIAWRLGGDTTGPYADVGTALHYAPYVELGHGNKPHVYPIYTPGGTFTGNFGYVSAKPTPAYPFLVPALAAARA